MKLFKSLLNVLFYRRQAILYLHDLESFNDLEPKDLLTQYLLRSVGLEINFNGEDELHGLYLTKLQRKIINDVKQYNYNIKQLNVINIYKDCIKKPIIKFIKYIAY